ncbi:E3 ubiquitin-protein ligase SSM4 [Sugiyamaella lignohabitans]|uniref:RING-type E3 ubiquitin transferase n=1 Tax=Sugiyamaella lignohabitans TaxID=796027 RepID=A0A167ETJ3_9ASCO|nr:E3 ubiquitin-protein ligase SSM4 [Sugiyamaella lignohabitans]ANB14435.1 E3 ubiquitin-protein ligase SSM4 [Sugiyamaella lignohabitans]
MIVREWILLNDAFVRDLQMAGNAPVGNIANAIHNNNAQMVPQLRIPNPRIEAVRAVDENPLDIELDRLRADFGAFDAPQAERANGENVALEGRDQNVENANAIANDNANGRDGRIHRPQDFALPVNVREDDFFFGGVDDEPEDLGEVGEVEGIRDIIGLKGPIVNAFATCAAATVLSAIALACLYLLPYATGRLVVILLGESVSPILKFYKQTLESQVTWVNNIFFVFASFIDTRILASNPDFSLVKFHEAVKDLTFNLINGIPSSVNSSIMIRASITSRLLLTFLGYSISGTFLAAFISNSNLTASRTGRDMLRVLKEMGAICKVITVIGIELVLFPIFCGLLLDFSLLPLFETASIADQVNFAVKYPVISTILHWALGTCYMFIFAMFVSLCRKIMRPGVLYFVRDPNDPNFHPIKDVLDRGLMSQLAKIGLSALIYGALIVLCLGGVIYTLRYLNVEFLPVSFVSTTREHIVIMIPFCAAYFLTLPIFIRTVRNLSVMRKIWAYAFESSCSYLRLSSFILNKPVPQEQGTVHYGSIAAWFMSSKPDYSRPVTIDDIAKNGKWDGAYFVKDGGFVRAPDTDSISSKKKLNLFIPVTKDDVRLDGVEEGSESNELEKYSVVYRPPHFRIRIALLLCCIWGYGALVVMSMILIPIYTGHVMSQFLLHPIFKDMCDVFQFILGSIPLFILFYTADNWDRVKEKFLNEYNQLRQSPLASSEAASGIVHLFKLLFSILVCLVVPTAIGGILDLYISSPLYHVLSSEIVYSKSMLTKFISGVLSILLAKNVVMQHAPNSSLARSFRALSENGWIGYQNPMAATKLLLPLMSILGLAAICPPFLCWALLKIWYHDVSPETQARMYVFCYPVLVVWIALDLAIYSVRTAIKLWVTKARDDIYLVSRQLENLEH